MRSTIRINPGFAASLVLLAGSTAMAIVVATAASFAPSRPVVAAGSSRTRKTRMGREIFLTIWSPISSNAMSSSRWPT